MAATREAEKEGGGGSAGEKVPPQGVPMRGREWWVGKARGRGRKGLGTGGGRSLGAKRGGRGTLGGGGREAR